MSSDDATPLVHPDGSGFLFRMSGLVRESGEDGRNPGRYK